jgi:putative membrane-bound dehydrogenase-like protein
VFVCQSPDILVFEDLDGDGIADGPPKKFLTGFKGFDHDHGVHGINIGPDGKLYFTVGDQGVDGLQSADGKGRKWKSGTPDCQAGTVWRCDMDGTNLELIAHNFRNNYECCVNSFGEVWLSDNDDDGNQQTRICYVMPGGNYGYYPRGPGQSHWHEEQPGIVHKALRTGFGSPTGICFYEGTLLPEKYRGQLLHTDAGPREFRCFHLKPKGAGYELEKENLVTSTDTWFRLSDVCVAPDGSVMLADWYDPGVGGHGMGDWTRGRIYRVTPKGHKGYKVPEVKVDTKEGIADALDSPCLAARSIAIRKVKEMADKNAKTFVIELVAQSPSAMLAARATWLAHGSFSGVIGSLPQGMLGKLVAASDKHDEDPRIRVQNVRNLPVRYEAETADEISQRFGQMQWIESQRRSPNISVFREILLMIASRKADETVVELFYRLAKLYDGQDNFYRAALNIACGTDPERRKAILADFDKHFPEWNDKVADLVWELRPASVLPRLGTLLEDPKRTPAQKGRIVDILAVTDDPAAGKTMLAVLKSDAAQEVKAHAIDSLKQFLPTKWKALQGGKELNAAIDDLLKTKETQVVGLQLVAAVGATDRVGAVIHIAEGDGGPIDHADPTQDEAVRTLGKLKTAASVDYLTGQALGATVNPVPTPRVRAAIAGLAAMMTGQPKDDIGAKALAALQRLVTEHDHATPRQQLAVEVLAGTRPGTVWLLGQREKGELPKELVADAGRLLRNSPFQGERNKAMLLFPAAGKLDPKKLPAPAILAKRTGNAKHGEQVLAATLKSEAQCLRCHMVRGVGGNIGPDLSMIGKKASKENLFESILLPSKAIADQYVQWKVNTADGKAVTGLLVAENEASLTLRDANGKDYTFAQKDLDGPKQKSLTSLMPDNLVAAMTEDELIDLVEYLLTLKTAALSPDSWQILGPFANDAGDTALDKDFGIETAKAIDLNASLQGRDGPVRWTTVRPTATGYVDLMAHYSGKSPSSASYLYRVIESPADQDATILFGNDDGAKVWINGEKVFENREHLAAEPARHKIPVKLKKGPNAVLIKIVNGNDPHGLYFTLTSEQELKAGK